MLSEKFKKALREELEGNNRLVSFFNEIKEEIGEKPVDIVKIYPESWEVFCSLQPILPGETIIGVTSDLDSYRYEPGETCLSRDPEQDRNLLPNEKMAEAMLALCQLLQLRDFYRHGWVPSDGDKDIIYSIIIRGYENTEIDTAQYTTNIFFSLLSFPSRKARDLFMHNFSDLIEKAKPLFI